MNTSGYYRTLQLACLLVFTCTGFAPALLACSGPGAPTAIARAIAMGYASFCVAALLAIPVMMLRLTRRGMSVATLSPFVLLVFHPAWTVSAKGGDCGTMLEATGMLATAVWVPFLLYELVAVARVPREERRPVGVAGLLITALLLSAAVTTYFLPWKLEPLPSQGSYLRYSPFDEVQDRQNEYKAEHGVYAKSAKALFGASNKQIAPFQAYLDNGDSKLGRPGEGCSHVGRMLQGTADDPTAWQTDAGLTDWAVIVRPVGFPADHVWVQYLFLSNGSIWAKPDPGTGEYLLEGVPEDLVRDGWRKTTGGYIRPEDLMR